MSDPASVHPFVDGLNAASRLFKWGAWLGVALVVASGITIVEPDEVALRLRFGRLTGSTAADQVHQPGLLLSFPYLVDEIVRVPVKRVHEMKIDALRAQSALAFREVDITRDGYAITGDHNLIQPEVVLKYQITNPVQWALRIAEPERVVHDIVTSALVRSIGAMGVDAALSERKRELAITAQRRAQARIDAQGGWAQLVSLEFVTLKPPAQVARHFADVQNAFSDVKTQEENARAREAEDIARAEAERDEVIAEAEGEALREVADARAEVEVFLKLLAEYRQSPTVVWQRLYQEGVQQILSRVEHRTVLPGGTTWGLAVPGASPATSSDREDG